MQSWCSVLKGQGHPQRFSIFSIGTFQRTPRLHVHVCMARGNGGTCLHHLCEASGLQCIVYYKFTSSFSTFKVFWVTLRACLWRLTNGWIWRFNSFEPPGFQLNNFWKRDCMTVSIFTKGTKARGNRGNCLYHLIVMKHWVCDALCIKHELIALVTKMKRWKASGFQMNNFEN